MKNKFHRHFNSEIVGEVKVQCSVMGAAGLGLGALAYYGPGYSARYSNKWADYVSERIHSTYACTGGVLAVAATTIAVILRSAVLTNAIKRSPWEVVISGACLTLLGTKAAGRSVFRRRACESSLCDGDCLMPQTTNQSRDSQVNPNTPARVTK